MSYLETMGSTIRIEGKEFYISGSMKKRIDEMSREDILSKIRFGSSDDDIFVGDNYKYMMYRFDELGGFDSSLSKRVGW